MISHHKRSYEPQEGRGVTGVIYMEGEVNVNRVIDLVVAKGESNGQVFLAKGKPYGKTFNAIHTSSGRNELNSCAKVVPLKPQNWI